MSLVRISADQWYQVRTVGDGVTHISEPWIKEFYRCNIWHVRGRDRDLLVDSGLGAVPLRREVPRLSERHVMAVASHTHFDHIGAHHEFDDCYVHRDEADIIADPRAEWTLADLFLNEEMFDALPPEPFALGEYAIRGPAKFSLLDEGDVIDLGDRRFEVIHTPGHSPGGIALWEEEAQILFSGDIIYDGPLIEDTYHANLDDYARSMERLLELPVRTVHGGHFPSFSGDHLRHLVREWLESHGR